MSICRSPRRHRCALLDRHSPPPAASLWPHTQDSRQSHRAQVSAASFRSRPRSPVAQAAVDRAPDHRDGGGGRCKTSSRRVGEQGCTAARATRPASASPLPAPATPSRASSRHVEQQLNSATQPDEFFTQGEAPLRADEFAPLGWTEQTVWAERPELGPHNAHSI
jgi:hypothetical protein